jgi:membrane protein DedA with SNARE-associated domain
MGLFNLYKRRSRLGMTQHAYAQTQKFGDKYTNFSVFFHPFLRGQLG